MQSFGTNPTEIGIRPAIHTDRRRRVRHKIQLPAYVSLGDNPTDTAIDLSEIINLSEDGMAIQTSSSLKVDQRATFVLDLPETNTKIRTDGKVVWAGSSGRVGIKFAGMSRDLHFELKKWLFANAVAGWVNHTAEDAQSGAVAEEVLSEPPPAVHYQTLIAADHSVLLTGLEAVKREVEGLGTDLDAALYLIARRAQAFTHADSAAIALTEGEDMVCRATSGPSAPPAGAHLKVGSGFSGECVRSGLLLRCDDSETDSRVDPESCRYLGIRSMIATPIRWDVSIIGLLEVFSPEPNAFSTEADLVLTRLAEITAEAVHRAGSAEDRSIATAEQLPDEFIAEEAPPFSLKTLYRSRNALLFVAGLTVLLVALWVILTWGDGNSHESAPASTQSKTAPSSALPNSGIPENLPALRRLADQGDPTAEFAIGARYATGEEVPQDYAQAVHWFTKAAQQGQVAAQATLGAFYWAGRGVPPDLMRAYFWSFLAEAGGDEASRSRVALLASRLTRGQILAAQKQANEWFKQHQVAQPSPEVQ